MDQTTIATLANNPPPPSWRHRREAVAAEIAGLRASLGLPALPITDKIFQSQAAALQHATDLRAMVNARPLVSSVNAATPASGKMSFGKLAALHRALFTSAHHHQTLRSANDESGQTAAMVKNIVEAGVVVAGLPTAGVVSRVRPGSQLRPDVRAFMQSEASRFMNMTSATPDVAELNRVNPCSNSARQFLQDEGRMDKWGDLILS